MKHQYVVILDFGSQYTQLIARAIRELQVFCEVFPGNTAVEEYANERLVGIILSGGPASVTDQNAPRCPREVFSLRKPILGICYGLQLLAQAWGGRVQKSTTREYGQATLTLKKRSPLFKDVAARSVVWMSHGDTVVRLPRGFDHLAATSSVEYAAFGNLEKKIFGVQFHPEVVHTKCGRQILANFVFNICGAIGDWTIGSFVKESVEKIRSMVGDERVLCGISGGVDSSVCAVLLHRSIGDRLVPIFVDNGLLRANEAVEVGNHFSRLGIQFAIVDARQKFLSALQGVSDPEQKRRIIGHTFISVFENEAKKLGEIKFLAQGTLYPDMIESRSVRGPSATIKTHHNVGGLPDELRFSLVEPLKELFKDEVRAVGKKLGLPPALLERHPFPGPGLAVRVIGEITPERLNLLREADTIFVRELKREKLYASVWQAFTVLLPVRTVGVMGDERTYENVLALRAVTSRDGMTADWARLPQDFLAKVSNRIINEAKGINRVVYDISSKPPATIEWE